MIASYTAEFSALTSKICEGHVCLI